MTEVEAQKLVTVIATVFSSQLSRMSDTQQADTQRIYRQFMADLDYAACNAAVANLIATAKFLPTIAEIRAATFDLAHGQRRAGGDAWGDVRHAIGQYGSYRMPGRDFQFDDPVTARAVSALGWRDLCLSESQVADRARFIELYDKLAGDARQSALTNTLPAMKRYRELHAATSDAPRGTSSIGEALAKLRLVGDE